MSPAPPRYRARTQARPPPPPPSTIHDWRGVCSSTVRFSWIIWHELCKMACGSQVGVVGSSKIRSDQGKWPLESLNHGLMLTLRPSRLKQRWVSSRRPASILSTFRYLFSITMSIDQCHLLTIHWFDQYCRHSSVSLIDFDLVNYRLLLKNNLITSAAHFIRLT